MLFLIKYHTMKKEVRGSGGIGPCVNLCTRWRWVVSFMA